MTFVYIHAFSLSIFFLFILRNVLYATCVSCVIISIHYIHIAPAMCIHIQIFTAFMLLNGLIGIFGQAFQENRKSAIQSLDHNRKDKHVVHNAFHINKPTTSDLRESKPFTKLHPHANPSHPPPMLSPLTAEDTFAMHSIISEGGESKGQNYEDIYPTLTDPNTGRTSPLPTGNRERDSSMGVQLDRLMLLVQSQSEAIHHLAAKIEGLERAAGAQI